jgi:hypothetical protein
LERALYRGTFLLDVSREVEFRNYVTKFCENFVTYQLGEEFESKVRLWTDFLRFMPDDAGGIMSHINTLMEQEHGHFLYCLTDVDGYTMKMEQLVADLQRFRMLCKDFWIQDREYDCLTINFLVTQPRSLRMDEIK